MGILGAIVEAVLAAAVVGVAEGVRAAGRAFDLPVVLVIAGLATLGAFVAALAVRGLLEILVRVPPIAAWLANLSAGGAARAGAVWRALLWSGVVIALALPLYIGTQRAFGTFRFGDASLFALGITGLALVLMAILVPLAFALDRRVARWLPTAPRAAGALDGRRGWVALVVVALVIARGPVLAFQITAPAVEPDAVVGACLLLVMVGALRMSRVGQRRVAWVVAAAVLVASPIAIFHIGDVAPARERLLLRGVFGRLVLAGVWKLADRDHDGYPAASFGGADCDDNDPRRYPTATDMVGNGIDENCTGRDATLAERVRRDVPHPAPAAPPRNIVLLSIDALRADHLGIYGYARPTSPEIDAFAATATRFAWALTPCPATRCAIPALMTARLPTSADVEAPTLAGLLRKAGWDTIALTCCDRFSIKSHDSDGFSTVDISADATRVRRAGQSNADLVADGALRWLGQRAPGSKPYLLWLHFYDPHHPYAAPEATKRFGSGDLDRYDAEIAFTDRHVGRVLTALDPATTVIALVADHGEEFGEHGIRFHARSLFNQVVRVPMLIRAPGAKPGVVDAPVSLVDVLPTLLALVGIESPAGINGRSLAADVVAPAAADAGREVLLELPPDQVIKHDAIALVAAGWKVIWNREANVWHLFRIAEDPFDQHDLADDLPFVLGAMRQRLFDAIDRELSMR